MHRNAKTGDSSFELDALKRLPGARNFSEFKETYREVCERTKKLFNMDSNPDPDDVEAVRHFYDTLKQDQPIKKDPYIV